MDGEPMHCIQGVITHFITDTLNQLDRLKLEDKVNFSIKKQKSVNNSSLSQWPKLQAQENGDLSKSQSTTSPRGIEGLLTSPQKRNSQHHRVSTGVLKAFKILYTLSYSFKLITTSDYISAPESIGANC